MSSSLIIHPKVAVLQLQLEHLRQESTKLTTCSLRSVF